MLIVDDIFETFWEQKNPFSFKHKGNIPKYFTMHSYYRMSWMHTLTVTVSHYEQISELHFTSTFYQHALPTHIVSLLLVAKHQ